MELADMRDLGSRGKPCRFKSCYPHQAAADFVSFAAALFCAAARSLRHGSGVEFCRQM